MFRPIFVDYDNCNDEYFPLYYMMVSRSQDTTLLRLKSKIELVSDVGSEILELERRIVEGGNILY